MDRDQRFMRLALALGRRGQGVTWPNPAVGCVLVRDDFGQLGEGRIVGRGWTQLGGRPHAETMALAQAGKSARGATAYVTLEPCAHTGQTPPCATALIQAGVARVVIALSDPDTRVAGRGVEMLQAAGIKVETGCCANEAWIDHRGFLSRITARRPLLTLKLATSFDGRIATASGESQWITGGEARRFGHALRARHDAVLIGAGTARADDPTLTVRDIGVNNQPVRVVASQRLDLPFPSKLFETQNKASLWLVHGSQADMGRRDRFGSAGATMIEVGPDADGAVDPTQMLAALAAKGLTRVYCEGGGGLAASLLRAGLVDDLYVFTAGLGLGADARPALGDLRLAHLTDAPRMARVSVQAIGADTVTLWRAQTHPTT